MEKQFEYIQKLSTLYYEYNNNQELLYNTLNSLDKEQLKIINNEYGNQEKSFAPVNLLRAEVSRQMLDGKKLDNDLVENIKQKIRDKDISYFEIYNENILNELKNYSFKNRDIFANWQRPWGIFHTFIYNKIERNTIRQYLEQICEQFIKDVELNSFQYHYVDFYGSSNFGSDFCWIAIYPIEKTSHQESYQFFLKISNNPKAGRAGGTNIKNKIGNLLKEVNSYEEVKKIFISLKEDINQKNQSLKGYFKFAPGVQAYEWERFKNEEIIALNYSDLIQQDITTCNSLEEINNKASLPTQNKKLENLWFFKKAKAGDIVFASKGVNVCLGIGIIKSDYFYENEIQNYNHKRKVEWITDKVYEHNPNLSNINKKNLFRPDSFSPIKSGKFILAEYLRLYPELDDTFKKYNLLELNQNEFTDEKIVTNEDVFQEIDDEELNSQNYWWLNANPSVWSISKAKINDRQTYTTRNERGNKRRIYKYFEQVKVGDIIIGYESSPSKQISGIFEITKPLHQSEMEGEVIEFKLIEKLEVPVYWNELNNNPELVNCKLFINNQGSLFKLNEQEFEIIKDLIDSKNIQIEKQINKNIPIYSYQDDPDKPFLDKKEIYSIISLLERKKNIILQGSPGVGKTFIARKIAYEMMKEKNDLQIETIQFHQSYSYEDFIQGLRPTSKGFEVKQGVFFNFCKKALLHPEKKYFFIIDEINRGNLSKIFGELMMLIESDKRDEKFKLHLTYSEDDEKFYIPKNIYIIGTMNTADRSLAIIDYALRRRFAFYDIKPSFENEFSQYLKDCGVSNELITHIKEKIKIVNNYISQDPNLGNGFQIGHSYFCTTKGIIDEKSWYKDILNYEIKPMLNEIWFDEPDQVNKAFELLEIK